VLAFDAASLCLAGVSRALTGRRLDGLRRAELPQGALVPSPSEVNVGDPAALAASLRQLVAEAGCTNASATLILPDGVARVALLDPPAGVEASAFARFRLAGSLPFPAGEAIVDVLGLEGRRVLGAAVRRLVVEGYEAVVRAAGLGVERVELSPIVGFDGLRRLGTGVGSCVDVILGDAAYSLAAWRDGALRMFRTRRRDPGASEAVRLRQEILRTASLAGDGAAPRMRIVGPGAGALVDALRQLGESAEPGWRAAGDTLPLDAAEIPWLGLGL
jgi:hypothetical protein